MNPEYVSMCNNFISHKINSKSLEDTISTYCKAHSKSISENFNLMSLNGWDILMKELIGRDIIDENFKGVRVEENLELIINIGRNKYGLSDEILFEGIDKQTTETLNNATITKGIRSDSVNYVTNQISSRLFLNIQNHLKLPNEEFQRLGFQALKQSGQAKSLIYGFNHNIFEILENVNTIANAKNSTKTTNISLERIGNNIHQMRIETKPIVGIKLEDPVIHWNIGMYNYFLNNCKNVCQPEIKIEIDDLTKSWIYTAKFNEDVNKTPKKSKFNFKHKIIRSIIGNKIERLQLEAEKIEIEKQLKTEQVEHLYNQTKSIMNQMRHRDTSDHMTKMAYLSVLMGKQMGISTNDLRCIVRSFPIHDIWKNSTPHQILHAKGKLDDDEYVQMQDHARGSEYSMIKCGYTLKEASIGSGHQLNADGSSYPALEPIRNANGEIVDVYAADWKQLSVTDMIGRFTDGLETLNAKRVYKEGMTIDFILNKIFRSDVEKKKILQEDIGHFGIEQFGKTLQDLKYTAKRYNPDTSKPISPAEREVMRYILGHSDKYKVQIPKGVQDLVQNHKIQYGSIEDRIHCIGLSIRKDYDKLQNPESKEMFKRNVPYELLNKYLPQDGISDI